MRRSLNRRFVWQQAAVACLLSLGCSASLRAESLDAYGGALSLQCGPNTKAISSSIISVTRNSGTVTLTFSSAHRLIVYDTITVSGTTTDGGSFNTPAGQLFTVASVPDSTTITYSQSGNNVSTTSEAGSAQLARYYAGKVGNRWWLCTPLGNAMWMNAVTFAARDSSTDYQNIGIAQMVHAKYASGVSGNATDNWAYQTALRLKSWGFNALGEYSDGNTYPSNVDRLGWKTPDHTIPAQARLPFILEPNPITYSAYNRNNYAPGPTKSELGLYKRSVYASTMRAMADIFDRNFSQWLMSCLKNGLIHNYFTGPHHEYVLAFVGDESDVTGGLMAGPDFKSVLGGGTNRPDTATLQNGWGTDPHWGWVTLIDSPVQAAVSSARTPEGLAPHDLVYADTTYYTKRELANWLQQTGDRGPGYALVAALNAAWGSKYDTFGTDALTHTDTCATGNGTAGPYTCTLANTPVTPLTVQVSVGGALSAGDDAAGVELKVPTGTGNFRSNSGTQPLGSITYSSGSVSITFSSPVSSGSPITVTYQTNGWGQGHGLLDEDGTCPSRSSGQSCWLPANPFWTANSTENQIQKDLDGFLFHFMNTYFATVKGDLQAAAPGYLYFPVDPIGSYGCPPHREVLEAAALYADVLPFGSIPASDPTGVVTDQQARIDFAARYAGDLPWMNINFLAAQADSYFPTSQFPLATGTLTFSTQLARGEYYQTKTNTQLETRISSGCNCSFAGTYPIVGQAWWGLYDDSGHKTNFGLLTRRDDPYDGVASTPNPGVDQWGYPTGCQGSAALPGPTTSCEQGSYGDALGTIISANSTWLTYAHP